MGLLKEKSGRAALAGLLRPGLFSLACLLAFLLPALTRAQTTIHVPADQPTIQTGINAANNGDTVLVAAGTYYENINFNGKAITVISASGAAQTTIDGSKGNGMAAVRFVSGEPRTAILNGFTIQNGGSEGALGILQPGILYSGNAQASLVNDIITNNHCYGVWADGGSPLIQNSNINNTLDNHGDCSFAGGAGIYLGNAAFDSSSNTVPSVIIGNTIEDNTQSGYEDAGGNGGAGIAVWGGDPVIEDNIIRNNHTWGGQGGAINLENFGSVPTATLIVQNLIYGNQAGSGGGALAFDGFLAPVTAFIANNTIVDNIDPTGEGCCSNDFAVSQIYSGDYGFDGPSIAFVNNIIAGNTTEPAVQCGWQELQVANEAAQPIFDHNVLLNKGGPFFTNLCVDTSAKYGNIVADPMFVNWTGNDYHLQAGSPAIDAGNTSVLQSFAANGVDLSKDFDGNPRVVDAASKGYPIVDIGAYEYTGAQDAQPTTIVLTPQGYEVAGGTRLGLTAQVISAAGTPTGSVVFLEDGKQIGTGAINANGVAFLGTPPLVPGTHSFLAKFPAPGDTNSTLPPATSVVVIVKVDVYSVLLDLTSSPDPSLVGQTVTFKINISAADGVPQGPVTLLDIIAGTTLATLTPDAQGNASYSTSTLTLGEHTIEADYHGNATHGSAFYQVTQFVTNGYSTTTTLTSSVNPSNVGQTVFFNAIVSSSNGSTPTGTLQFLDGSTNLGIITIIDGGATCVTSVLTAGKHNISAVFTPSGSYLASSASLIQVVNGAQATTTLTASPNPAYALQPVTLTARVNSTTTGTPTGTVTFSDGGAPLGTANLAANGTAALVTKFASASAAPHQLTAAYSGDATFGSSTSAAWPETIEFNPTTTLITTMVPNPVDSFVTATLSATVTSSTSPGNTPTGSVTFTAGGKPLGSGKLVNGAVSVPIIAGAPGSYAVIANYSGDTAFFPGASPSQTLIVIPDVVSVKLTSSKNPSVWGDSVTFTASVFTANPAVKTDASGPPLAGAFTFFDGKTQFGQPVQASSSGTATYTTSTLAVGTHPITAVFSGNADVTGATSNVVDQVVQAYTGDFTLDVTPPQVTIYTGEAARYAISVTPKNGFNLPLKLSCNDLPADAACSFSPVTIKNGAYASTLEVKTSAGGPVKAAAAPSAARWAGGAAALACVLGWFLVPRRRLGIWLGMILLAVFAALSGCGGGGTLTGATPAGTYGIAIMAETTNVAPQLSHETKVMLVVKSLF